MDDEHVESPLVLLVGGGSGTGKTTLAAAMSDRLRMPLSQTDDFRLFAQRITSPTELPELHFFVDPIGNEARAGVAAEELLEHLTAIAGTVSRGLEVVIAHHLATGFPIIIEGDAITPGLAARDAFVGVPAAGRVSAVFLREPDEARILAEMRARGRGVEALPLIEQERGARLARLYGDWIGEHATQLRIPVLEVRPRETLLERAVAALGRSLA